MVNDSFPERYRAFIGPRTEGGGIFTKLRRRLIHGREIARSEIGSEGWLSQSMRMATRPRFRYWHDRLFGEQPEMDESLPDSRTFLDGTLVPRLSRFCRLFPVEVKLSAMPNPERVRDETIVFFHPFLDIEIGNRPSECRSSHKPILRGTGPQLQ